MKLSVFSKTKGDDNKKSLNGNGGEVRPSAAAASANSLPDMVSTLGHGMLVTGNIVCDGSLQIFGHVHGDIHASHLVICEGAQVEGNVIAQDTVIHGGFKGTIHGNNVKLQGMAVVDGEVYSKSLTIEQNVQFEGVSRRLDNPVDLPVIAEAKGDMPLSLSMADAVPASRVTDLRAD